MPTFAPERLPRNIVFGRNGPVDAPKADHDARFAPFFAALGARRISLIDDLCADGVCRSVIDGKPIFTDNKHRAAWTAPLMAQRLRDALNKTTASDVR